MRIFLYAVVTLIAIILLFTPAHDIGAGVIAALLLGVVDISYGNIELLRFVLPSLRYWGQRVRLSISYLYRIKVDDDYLLIRGHRIKDQYQPVGGVMKRLPEGTVALSEFDATDDKLIPFDQTARDDLRIIIGGKHLFNFMRWYQSRKGRETDCWREFYEELVAPGIVPADVFGYVTTRHVRRHITPVRFSNHVQMPECLIAEIYELIPTEEQTKELKKLKAISSEKYMFAKADEIRQEGVKPGQSQNRRISITASWTL